MRYIVTHHPDGGEERYIARFADLRYAQFYARALCDAPGNNIRLLLIRDSRKGAAPINRYGWAA